MNKLWFLLGTMCPHLDLDDRVNITGWPPTFDNFLPGFFKGFSRDFSNFQGANEIKSRVLKGYMTQKFKGSQGGQK